MFRRMLAMNILLLGVLVVACSVLRNSPPLPTVESIVASTPLSAPVSTVAPTATSQAMPAAISPTHAAVQSASSTRPINWITNHNPLAQPNVAKPVVGVPFIDPVFKTSLVRLGDARLQKIPGIFPDYSKRQAWNADESLLLLRTGDGNALLYDGSTYQFNQTLDEVGGEDVFWHPANPSLLYYNPDNTLYAYNVATGERKKIFTFSDYAFANTRGEGNLSRDGRWYALVGQLYSNATGTSFKDLLVFDLATNQIASRLALPHALADFDWVSISPLGNYVVVDYATDQSARFNGVEVYDRNFKFLWQKPLGAGHSDLAMDANGNEVLVMDVYDANQNVTFVKKYRLSDGAETPLLDFSAYFDSHISCRNEQRAGWCFVSTFDYVERLTDDAQTWLPFEDEVFALKLDGSGDVERIAHHHSRRYSPTTPDSDRSNYFAEPHATVSRRGDRMVLGSNWRENVADEMSVDAYVIEWR